MGNSFYFVVVEKDGLCTFSFLVEAISALEVIDKIAKEVGPYYRIIKMELKGYVKVLR